MQDVEKQTDRAPTQGSRVVSLILRAAVPLLLLGLGWYGYARLFVVTEETKATEPEPRVVKTGATELRIEDIRTSVRTRGVVRAHNEVPLTAQVSGEIIRILPGFEDGAFFSEGEILLELDPRDLATAVIQAQAQVARAQSVYAQEKTRAEQALLNWLDLEYDEEPSKLVLREPQLREAEASMESAQAQLEQAQRNQERTKVRAPFSGRVRRRTVGLGQSVGPATPLGTVFAVDLAEVRLPIAARDLRFLSLPEGPEDPPLTVELRDALNPTGPVWHASIIRTEGAVDTSSLDLFAIAQILDPFGRLSGDPPLRIGQPVLALIPGHILENVIVVPRSAVRQLDRVFLIDTNDLTLHSHAIDPIWSDEERHIIRDPAIADGALLATTHLIYTPEGSKVEILAELSADPNTALATGPGGGASGKTKLAAEASSK